MKRKRDRADGRSGTWAFHTIPPGTLNHDDHSVCVLICLIRGSPHRLLPLAMRPCNALTSPRPWESTYLTHRSVHLAAHPHSKSQSCEKPSVLPTQVSLLQCLLHLLLSVFPLANLLECVVRDDVLQSFQFECVSCRHDVIVVDHLDEWLDLASLLHSLLSHTFCDFARLPLSSCDQCIWEWVALRARVCDLDEDDCVGQIRRSLLY